MEQLKLIYIVISIFNCICFFIYYEEIKDILEKDKALEGCINYLKKL